MKVRNISFVALFLGFLALSFGVNAQEVKIGWVNTLDLMAKAPQSEAARKRLEDEFSDRRSEMIAMDQDVKKMRERYQKDREVMRPDAVRQLEREIVDKERDIKRLEREIKEDASIRYNEISMQLRTDLLKLINEYAKKNGFDLILTEAGAAYAGDRVNITGEVLEALRAEFAKPSSAAKK